MSAPHEIGQQVRRELELHHADVESVSAEQVQRATVRYYARVLFEQTGANGTQEQQQAFREIRAYLLPRALFKLHDRIQADDAAQQALVKIYQYRATCRDAGSFLRWCDQILQRLIMDDRREQGQERRTEQGVEYRARAIGFYAPGDTVNEDSNPEEDAVADPQQDTPVAAMTEPMRAALIATLQDCLEDDRQAEVIGQLFMYDKTFFQVAELLQTSPVNVQVIRHRALKKLRDCKEMQQLVEDWDYP